MADLETVLSNRVAELEEDLAAARQHYGFDITELKGKHSNFLSERVRPLLNDAVDALEIDPPELGIAVRRVKTVLYVIKNL
tara:strand:- start:3640 stop:3882 length:243 start_codon:yes stop_codon:yes gene_type:complete